MYRFNFALPVSLQLTLMICFCLAQFVPPVGNVASVYIITDPDELIETYGVLVTDPLYIAAQTFFSQIPHPRKIVYWS